MAFKKSPWHQPTCAATNTAVIEYIAVLETEDHGRSGFSPAVFQIRARFRRLASVESIYINCTKPVS